MELNSLGAYGRSAERWLSCPSHASDRSGSHESLQGQSGFGFRLSEGVRSFQPDSRRGRPRSQGSGWRGNAARARALKMVKANSVVNCWPSMAARVGIEPAAAVLEAAIATATCEKRCGAGAQHGAQNLRDLAEVLLAWWVVAPEIRAAIVTMVRTAGRAAQ